MGVRASGWSRVISAEELQAGLQAQMDDVLAPSLFVEAPALDFSAGAYTPVAEASVQAVVVDCSLEAAPRFIPYVADQLPELLISFESSRPEVIPDPAILLQLALDWAQGDGSADRLQYYSADEVAPEVAPKKRAVLHLTKTDAQLAAQASTLGGGAPSIAKPSQPKSRVTTASLANQLQTITASLPALMKSVEDVAARQEAMERQLAAGPSAPLSQALGLGAKPKHGVQSLALLGPPPRTAKAQPVAQDPLANGPAGLAEAEVTQVQDDFGQPAAGPDALSQAVLEQSRALTSLVAQLAGASGDSVLELGVGVSALSAPGAGELSKDAGGTCKWPGHLFLGRPAEHVTTHLTCPSGFERSSRALAKRCLFIPLLGALRRLCRPEGPGCNSAWPGTGHGQPSGGADPAGFRSCSLPGRLCGANVNGQRPLRAWFPIEDPPSSMFTARSSRNWIPSKRREGN